MDAGAIDAVLAEMSEDEIRQARWFVDEFERDGLLDPPTAHEWRVRMRAFLEFLTAHEVSGAS